MIASLNGEVSEISADSLVIRLGGIGFRVYVPAPIRNRVHLGEIIDLHTYLVVREDALTLFGFESSEDRDYFILLLGVNGIGPRIALATLSTLSPDTIRRAVSSEQSDIFGRVPGVGKKTAQKILLHLQGRIPVDSSMGNLTPPSEVDAEVIAALTGLGYSIIEAQTALQALSKDAAEDVETRLRLALQYFSS
jgi:holliday junction DNA helicase RuvA